MELVNAANSNKICTKSSILGMFVFSRFHTMLSYWYGLGYYGIMNCSTNIFIHEKQIKFKTKDIFHSLYVCHHFKVHEKLYMSSWWCPTFWHYIKIWFWKFYFIFLFDISCHHDDALHHIFNWLNKKKLKK